MIRPLRSTLKALRREFVRASVKYPALFHEYLRLPLLCAVEDTPEGKMVTQAAFMKPRREMWIAFIEGHRNRETETWEKMYVTQDGLGCGRFYGDKAGLEDFMRLGESLHLAFCEIDQTFPPFRGIDDCLRIMYGIAYDYPSPLLCHDDGIWGYDKGVPVLSEQDRAALWSTPTSDGQRFPLHPTWYGLANNVYTSAIAAIEAVLHPADTVYFQGEEFHAPYRLERDDSVEATPDHGIASDTLLQHTVPATRDNSRCIFRLGGSVPDGLWDLQFKYGDNLIEGSPLVDCVGLRRIAWLLAQPSGRKIEAIVLLEGGEMSEGLSDELNSELGKSEGFSFQPVADNQATRDYMHKLHEIEDQLEIAKSTNNFSKLDELIAQRDAFQKQLDKISTFGKPKRLGGEPFRKLAHNTWRQNYIRTLSGIRKVLPHLAAHLKESIHWRGTQWWYESLEPMDWVL